jgi:hypothetical protein
VEQNENRDEPNIPRRGEDYTLLEEWKKNGKE